MKFFSILAATMSIFSVTEACKCAKDGGFSGTATKNCCLHVKGTYQFENDCQASSISESLSEFRRCCESQHLDVTSDCGH